MLKHVFLRKELGGYKGGPGTAAPVQLLQEEAAENNGRNREVEQEQIHVLKHLRVFLTCFELSAHSHWLL